jgi:hypothetical protein
VPYRFGTPLFVVRNRPGCSPSLPDLEVFLRLTQPRSLRPRDHPLMEFDGPSGFDPHSPPDRLSAPAPSMELPPRRRHQHRKSTCPGFTSPGTFPPRGFSPPRGFAPSGALRVCFAPLAPMGFLPSRVSPPKKPHPPCRWCLALLTFTPAILSAMTRRIRAPPPYAASVVPKPIRAFRALSSPGVRASPGRLFDEPAAAPFLGFRLPRVSPSPADGTDLRRSSSHALERPGSRSCPRVPDTPAPRSFTPQARWHCLSRGRLPLARFLAAVQLAPLTGCPVRAFGSPRAPGGVAAPRGPSLDWWLPACRSGTT